MLSCAPPAEVSESFEFGEPFWLELGRSAVSRDEETVVRFARVVENSTCPDDAACVWAGRTVVEVGIIVSTEAEGLVEIEVAAPDSVDRQRTIAGRRVEVLSFRPPNRLGGSTETPEIQLTVRATP
jgi:hypothetical protein